MSNMYCRYKNEKYMAQIHDKKITITSKIKQEGFDNYVDVQGKEHSDLFMRELDFGEVEVVYKENIEIGFEGTYFQLFSFLITQSNIETGRFTLFTDSEETARKYKFKKKEQFVFVKDISKEQIEKIKIVQKPIKEFEAYGIKELVIERVHIDEWLSSFEYFQGYRYNLHQSDFWDSAVPVQYHTFEGKYAIYMGKEYTSGKDKDGKSFRRGRVL